MLVQGGHEGADPPVLVGRGLGRLGQRRAIHPAQHRDLAALGHRRVVGVGHEVAVDRLDRRGGGHHAGVGQGPGPGGVRAQLDVVVVAGPVHPHGVARPVDVGPEHGVLALGHEREGGVGGQAEGRQGGGGQLGQRRHLLVGGPVVEVGPAHGRRSPGVRRASTPVMAVSTRSSTSSIQSSSTSRPGFHWRTEASKPANMAHTPDS